MTAGTQAPVPVTSGRVPGWHLPGLPVRLGVGRTLVMGIVNVTPDSFSDGGRHADTGAAVAHGLALVERGADLVDVGGESTRPGALRVPEDVEHARVLPVVRRLAAAGIAVSVDTMRASTAAAALDAGATLVNDVSGGLADPDMYAVVAAARVPYVVMHWRGHSADMASRASYGDVVADVVTELVERLEAVLAAGVDRDQVVLDPGLGFAKAGSDDLDLLAQLDRLAALGRPLLLGASRKAFLGRLLADVDGVPRGAAHRDDATAAVSVLAAAAGVWAVRVHDVAASADAVRVVAAVAARRRATGPA